MPDKEIFVLKIVWRKSIALLHRLTQAVQCGNVLTEKARRGTLPEFGMVSETFFKTYVIVACR